MRAEDKLDAIWEFLLGFCRSKTSKEESTGHTTLSKHVQDRDVRIEFAREMMESFFPD